MTAPEPEENEDFGNAEFSYARQLDSNGRRHLSVTYRDIKVRMSWVETERGAKDLANFAGSFPRLIKTVLREILVSREAQGLDDEIAKLFEKKEGGE